MSASRSQSVSNNQVEKNHTELLTLSQCKAGGFGNMFTQFSFVNTVFPQIYWGKIDLPQPEPIYGADFVKSLILYRIILMAQCDITAGWEAQVQPSGTVHWERVNNPQWYVGFFKP